MESFSRITGQYLQYRPPSQSSQPAIQLTQGTMMIQQAGIANNVYQYGIANTGIRPPQSAHFTSCNGASNRQMSNWQSSSVHQAVSSQQPAGGNNNCYQPTLPYGNLQNSSPNTQSGNPRSQVINGFQVAAQQGFNQNSGHKYSSQYGSDMMKANIQQVMSANWNQSVKVYGKQSTRIQNGNVVSDLQHRRVQRNLYQNVNGDSTNTISAFTPSAISLPPAQAVCNSTLVSANAQGIQTASNQHHRQISTQHGFPPSIPPPHYNAAVSQSYRNNSNTTNPPSSRQRLQVSSMSQKTQQYSTQLNSTPNNVEAATCSINSNSSNSSQYEINHFLSKTNEPHLNPAADTQRQKLSHQMSTRFTDSLCKSFTAGSDGRPPVYTSSPYNGKQFESNGRMMESNLTMVPVPSSVICHNSNASQSMPLHSRQTFSLHSEQSLPKTPQNSLLATQQIVDELPQMMQQPENISPQTNKIHSSVANNHEILEILEMLTSINPNDSSIHSSPGRTGPRAIAIVQPLAQECHQVASKQTSSKTVNQEHECTTTDVSLSNPEKFFISPNVAQNKKAGYLSEVSIPLKGDCWFSPKNPNQVRSNESAVRHSATFDDDAVVLSSDSAGPQHSHKPLCADYTGSVPTVNMHSDRLIAPAAQQSVRSEVPKSQNGDKDKSEMLPDAKACVCELSSFPTTPWTVTQIRKLIEKAEKAQMKSVFLELNADEKILSMFWSGRCKTLANQLRRGWYKDLMAEALEYFKHLTIDTVILSQVKEGFEKQLKRFHVITDNEVYSELPYTSSWLNTNEQLDDIDKEFGFPWSLKHRPHNHDSDSQPDQVERVKSICAQIVSEMQKEALLQTELEPVDLDEEKHSTVDATSTQPASPKNTESTDPSDPYYSFEIKVLPPNEAKVIFEQSKMPQSTETDCQPDKVTNNPVQDELPEVVDVTISDSKLENRAGTTLEQFCCITRWKEMVLGSNTPSSSTCQCKKEQSHEDCTDKKLDEAANVSKFHSAMVGKNQIQILSWPELCDEVSQTIDSADNDEKPYSHSDKVPNNMSPLSINSSQSSIMFVSKTEDEVPNQMPDLEENCEQAHLKPSESSQSTGSHSSEKVLTGESEVGTEITTNLVEDCAQAPDATAASRTFSRKHEAVDLGSQQLLESVSKYRKVFVDAADSDVRTVELALFGSAPQKKCILVGGHKSHRSSSQAASHEEHMPPEVLSVSLSPLKRKFSEAVPKRDYVIKRWTHEIWRKGFPPTRIKLKSKVKTQKFTSCFKQAKQSGPTNTEELPSSSEVRLWKGNTKRCQSLKRGRPLSYGLKLGEKKTKKDAVAQSAVHMRSKAKNGSQENNVLRFSVLPETFSFKDASNGIKDDPDHASDKADLVRAHDTSSNISVKRARGKWYPNPEKNSTPLHRSTVPKTSSVFHEYKKKYTEKTAFRG